MYLENCSAGCSLNSESWNRLQNQRVRSTFLPGAAFWYTRVNESKRGIEKYLLLKPKRSYLTQRSSMCAFNLQSSTNVCLQEFLNTICEEVENAFSQPNTGIQEIEGNLRLKHKTNVSDKLLCWVFAQLRELNPTSESESEKHVSSRSCVSIYPCEWEETRYWEISASKQKPST